jgi:cytochrome c-type biogenesis protein CcmH
MAERRRRIGIVLLLGAALGAGAAFGAGAIDAFEFDDPAQAARYQGLIDELRCPKCLNTNLSGSDAPIAADLRALVYRRVRAGEDDVAIRAYLTERYGDFVLYDPPMRLGTIALWLIPATLLLVGIVAIGRIVRVRAGDAPRIAAEEAEVLARLLAEADATARTGQDPS